MLSDRLLPSEEKFIPGPYVISPPRTDHTSRRMRLHRRKKYFSIEVLIRRNRPMAVTKCRIYNNNSEGFSVCPNCDRAIDREYVNFCCSCGQRLSWIQYAYGKIEIEESIYLQTV